MSLNKIDNKYDVLINEKIPLESINELLKQVGFDIYSSDEWNKVIQASTFMVQIRDKNKLMGFGRTVDDGSFCMIYDIVVHPDCRRSGVGSAVLNEIKKYINQNDFVSVSLFYWEQTAGIVEFYEKNGFKKLTNAMRLSK